MYTNYQQQSSKRYNNTNTLISKNLRRHYYRECLGYCSIDQSPTPLYQSNEITATDHI